MFKDETNTKNNYTSVNRYVKMMKNEKLNYYNNFYFIYKYLHKSNQQQEK